MTGRLNCGAVLFLLGIAVFFGWAAKADAAYDLAVTSFRIEPAQGNPGTKFIYYVTIRNVGSVPAQLRKLVIESNDNVLESAALWPWGTQPKTLNPGESYDCTISYLGGPAGTGTLPPGRNIIKAIINSDELAQDLSPANNSQFIQVEVLGANGEVPGWPDLYIKDKYTTTSEGRTYSGLKAEVTAGNSVKVALHPLENRGTEPALLPAGMLLVQATERGQPVPLGSNVVSTGFIMKSGNGVHVEVEIPAEKLNRVGLHEVLLNADPLNVVRETNENNLLGFFIDVKGCDLAVTGVTAAPQDPNTQQPVTLSVTVKNLSTGKAVYTPQGPVFLVYGPPSKTLKASAPVSFTLAAGQEYKATFTVPPFTSSAGTYNFAVTVDQTGDPNPANNVFTLPLVIRYPSAKDLSSGSPQGTTAPATPSGNLQPLQQPGTRLPQTAPPKINTPAGIR